MDDHVDAPLLNNATDKDYEGYLFDRNLILNIEDPKSSSQTRNT